MKETRYFVLNKNFEIIASTTEWENAFILADDLTEPNENAYVIKVINEEDFEYQVNELRKSEAA